MSFHPAPPLVHVSANLGSVFRAGAIPGVATKHIPERIDAGCHARFAVMAGGSRIERNMTGTATRFRGSPGPVFSFRYGSQQGTFSADPAVGPGCHVVLFL